MESEFLRISKTTSFNGIKLFNGSLDDGLNLQLGFGVDGLINASVGGAVGTGTFTTRTTIQTGAGIASVALGDLNGDGVLDMVTADYNSASASVLLGNGDGTFKTSTGPILEQ